MKILQLSNKVPYPLKDGGAIATYYLAKSLRNLGHEVTNLSMNTSKHYVSLEEIPINIKEDLNLVCVEVDTSIKVFSALSNLLFSSFPYNAKRFICKKYQNKLVELLTQNTYDVIQLEGLYLTPYIPIIRKHSQALLSVRMHNVEHEIWERTCKLETNFLKKAYLSNLTKRLREFEISILNQYDVVVPITERDGKKFGELGNIKPEHVVPFGIEGDLFTPDSSKMEPNTLFIIGSLDWIPNQEGLLWFVNECWPQLHEKFPECKLYAAGRNAPQWLVDKLKDKKVNYCGEVESAHDFMNSKSIMLVPLFSGSGMRVKIIEGMALGKAIVTTSIGTEGINTTSGVNILVGNNPVEFTKQVEGLLANKSRIDEIGQNAINFVRSNYDNNTITKSLADFYENNLAN